jgi:hypothetical protein
MMSKSLRLLSILSALLALAMLHAAAETTAAAKRDLSKLLLGKDVKALLDMPAYKDGVDLYVSPKGNKRLDDRGIDLKELAKFLKEKGVGVERDEWATVTDVKVDSDRIEIHLGGGGEGGGASKQAAKKGAGYKRAGGTRINFRYGRDLTDADLQPAAFLPILGRVLDTGRVQEKLAVAAMPDAMKAAIQAKDVVEGMTYQMVLLSAGEPDQKKVDDSGGDDSLKETWYYLKDGHRWVVRFENGKVAKVTVY